MKRSDLLKLKAKFTYKELRELTNIPERTLQRWVKEGIPPKSKTPNRQKIERLEVAREVTKRKRNKEKIRKIIEELPDDASLSQSKNKLKSYLNIRFNFTVNRDDLKNSKILNIFRAQIIREWLKFKDQYRFMYIMCDIIDIIDPDNHFSRGKIVTKTIDTEFIESMLSDLISKMFSFLGQYEESVEFTNFTLKILNIKQ